MSDSTPDRLMQAAKELFAQNGYEHTSTAAITRRAGTSESQLIRHFGGKRGLLNAIFDRGWAGLITQIEKRLRKSPNPVAAIEAVLATIIAAFHRDHALAYLLLFEGRRIRETGLKLELSEGYKQFAGLLLTLIRAAQKAELISPQISSAAVGSALMGAAEGMIRDRMTATLSRKPQPFSRSQVMKVFALLLRSMREPSR